MREIGLALATVAALATTAVVNSPAEARGGRNAAIGFGVAAGVLALQLPFCFEVRALGDRLVSSAPE